MSTNLHIYYTIHTSFTAREVLVVILYVHIISAFSTHHTHTHTHTQTLISILRENLQEREEAVFQRVREEERARRGIDHLIKAEKEAAKQRYKRLLKEVDDEVELLMHHTRRGYDFHPTGAPPLPPQNTVSVFFKLSCMQSCAT